MRIKKRILSGVVTTLTCAGIRGALYSESFAVNSAIPDGNPVGAVFRGAVSDASGGSTVGSLSVTLNITGGYNGDLYSYLVAPNGTMVVLMNQPGVTTGNPFGFSGSGFNITLSDTGTDGNIQTFNETPGGAVTGSFTAAGTLANLNGSSIDGTWTLFFADESSGGGASVLNSWSLGITTPVPEPMTVALGTFAGLLATAALIRRFKTRIP